jgi:hypothetical protein
MNQKSIYAMQVKKVDGRIYRLLEKALTINLKDNQINVISDEQMAEVYKRIEAKKKMIFSLFEGSFAENEQIVKQRYFFKKHAEIGMYDTIANHLLAKRINKVLDELIESELSTELDIVIGLDRKFFLNKILDENIEFELARKELDNR